MGVYEGSKEMVAGANRPGPASPRILYCDNSRLGVGAVHLYPFLKKVWRFRVQPGRLLPFYSLNFPLSLDFSEVSS